MWEILSPFSRTAMETEHYAPQNARWPARGRHILARFDDESVVVYQAYRPSIGRYAAEHQRFGGDFSFARMSWVKTNFLWMMYRSGWGTKEGQEVTLAVRIRRAGFDALLAAAVHSSYLPDVDGDRETWERRGRESDVRLQWDPDHDPGGAPQARRAVQLGLRGETLRRYGTDWIVRIDDISDFVAAQREHRHPWAHDRLETPRETVYPVRDPSVAARLGVEALP